MEAIICDRCGKRTNKFEATRLRKNVFIGRLGINYDLCNDCVDKFNEFINNHDFPKETERKAEQ